MRVVPISSEKTRFWVESTSLSCLHCSGLFSRLNDRWRKLTNKDKCPKCFEPTLEVRWHLVDVAEYHPLGRCACEHWSFNLKPKIEKLSSQQREALSQREASKLRCSHVEAARTCALDIAIGAHEHERLKNGNGQREENAA